MECVRSGKLESATMPLAESLALVELMDRARAVWADEQGSVPSGASP
jgi:hypothetical protein